MEIRGAVHGAAGEAAVSYTHLDVYKRQVQTDDQGALYLHLTPLEATDKLVVASWNGRDYSGLSERNLDGTFAIALAPTEAAVYYQWHIFEDGLSLIHI